MKELQVYSNNSLKIFKKSFDLWGIWVVVGKAKDGQELLWLQQRREGKEWRKEGAIILVFRPCGRFLG